LVHAHNGGKIKGAQKFGQSSANSLPSKSPPPSIIHTSTIMSSAAERKAQIAAAQEERERAAREAAEREAKELAEIEEQEARKAEEQRQVEEAQRAEEARRAEEAQRAVEAAAKKRQDDAVRAKLMEAQTARSTAARPVEVSGQSSAPTLEGSTELGAW
jgi:hypothetical protein